MYLHVAPSASCRSLHQIKMSKKMMESLGLDYGDWLIFGTAAGEVAVSIINMTRREQLEFGEDKALISHESPLMGATAEEIEVEPHKLTIGADPEFFLVDTKTGGLEEGYKFFSHEDQLGSDGDLCELRPDYALSPEQLTANIGKLVRRFPRNILSKVNPVATSYLFGRCCGFHVHLGLPIELISFAAEKTEDFIINLVTTLDYFVSIPVTALDTDEQRRRCKAYGKPGDYKLSMRTLEYRTPGGFHLKSPHYTENLLTSSFGIVEKIIHEAEIISGGWIDMEPIVNFEYFKNKYDIPGKDVINTVLTGPRNMLEKTAETVIKQLKILIGDGGENILTKRIQTKSLLEEWDETKP